MDDWQNASNGKIKFQEVPNDSWNWFLALFADNFSIDKIDDSDASWGTLGRAPYAGIQMNTSTDVGVMRHELGHILGLTHEHERPDRNGYVDIHWDNIQKKFRGAFSAISANGTRYFYIYIRFLWWTWTIKIPYKVHYSDTYGSFDYNSIMIYSSKAFAIDGNKSTITKKDGGRIYYNAYLSETDKYTIRSIYR